ncbi:MAG: glycosyltransferase family 2 protein [Patescibacteria group bacterium]|nr:glycosyltransferase family 2 protein [Patescibacteria group bacterium]
MTKLDILIPTFSRKTSLAVTLTSLVGQTFQDFDLVISDQTKERGYLNDMEFQTLFRFFKSKGKQVKVFKHFPSKGMAEQRDFLLSQAASPYVLYLDDDLILEPKVIARMHRALKQEKCGFVGCAPVGLSHLDDVRLREQAVEFWTRKVSPEIIDPDSPVWQRHKLHNAANLYHLQQSFPSQKVRRYKIAWIGACVMYDREKLVDVGGFSFWPKLPSEHAGEEVYVQNLLLRKYGGCGIIPSEVYHLELPTTVKNRQTNAISLLSAGV